jgi:hypothetical protein
MKKVLIFLFCFGLLSTAFAQKGVFTVVSSKNVVMKKGGAWVNLNVGDKLKADDVIKTNTGGAANFLHSSGKVVKFTAAQETTVSNFEKTITPGSQSANVAGALLDMDNKMKRSSSFTSGNVGATRATETVSKDIFLITPRKENNNPSKVMDEFPVFLWNNVQGEKEYLFTLLTEELNPIKNMIVKDTIFKYGKDDPKLEKGATYVCFVKPMKSQKQCEYQTFTIASDSEAKTMKERLDAVETMVTDADEVAKCVLRGTTYEELGLYTNAYFSYSKAIKLEPGEKEYKKMLADLLWKVNLIKQTYYLSGFKLEK